jgi:hypothetical protein
MASGSFNIDSYSWYRSLPLSTDTLAYSTGTMFAVGPSSFINAYSWYQYTSTVGFPDTSTMSVNFTGFVCTSLISTVNSLGKIFKSTIPTADFRSTYSAFTDDYPGIIPISSIFLGGEMSNLIASKQYNVFVDFQYNLYLSTPHDQFTWISTTGYLGSNTATKGSQVSTRLGNITFETIRQTVSFAPQTNATQDQIGPNPSSFYFTVTLQSTIAATNTKYPAYDIFVPGANNYVFTLVPTTSTVIN